MFIHQRFATAVIFHTLMSTVTIASDPTPPSLAPLAKPLKALVEQHYPEATFTHKGNKIHFEFNTRKYMIHGTDMMGGWRDAREQIGPQAPSRNPKLKKQGGVIGNIGIRVGPYKGQAALPQVFHHHYFDRLGMAPYSEVLDCSLVVNLSYAQDISPEFQKDFKALLNDFDRYVKASK